MVQPTPRRLLLRVRANVLATPLCGALLSSSPHRHRHQEHDEHDRHRDHDHHNAGANSEDKKGGAHPASRSGNVSPAYPGNTSPVMELGGLEPPTSWVRSRRSSS